MTKTPPGQGEVGGDRVRGKPDGLKGKRGGQDWMSNHGVIGGGEKGVSF